MSDRDRDFNPGPGQFSILAGNLAGIFYKKKLSNSGVCDKKLALPKPEIKKQINKD